MFVDDSEEETTKIDSVLPLCEETTVTTVQTTNICRNLEKIPRLLIFDEEGEVSGANRSEHQKKDNNNHTFFACLRVSCGKMFKEKRYMQEHYNRSHCGKTKAKKCERFEKENIFTN